MKINIVNRITNDVLKRQDVKLEVYYDQATPSRMAMKKEIASALKANDGLIVIRNIYSAFGSRKADVFVSVYNDEATMKISEQAKLLAKHKPKEDKKDEKEDEKQEEKKE